MPNAIEVRDLGQTIVMVTHEPDDKAYVDRVIWLKDGLIEPVPGPDQKTGSNLPTSGTASHLHQGPLLKMS